MTKAEDYVNKLYSRFKGRVPIAVGVSVDFGHVYPFVFEGKNNTPIGLVGIAANNKQDTTEVQLFHVSSFYPHKGHGTEIMHYLCQEADKFKVRIYLQAEIQFGDNETLIGSDLVNWYKKFNFVGNGIMTREPNA